MRGKVIIHGRLQAVGRIIYDTMKSKSQSRDTVESGWWFSSVKTLPVAMTGPFMLPVALYMLSSAKHYG